MVRKKKVILCIACGKEIPEAQLSFKDRKENVHDNPECLRKVLNKRFNIKEEDDVPGTHTNA